MAAGESGICGRPRGHRVMNVDKYIGADNLRAPLHPSRTLFLSTRTDQLELYGGPRAFHQENLIDYSYNHMFCSK